MKFVINTNLQFVLTVTYSLISLNTLRAGQSHLNAGDIVFLGANSASVSPNAFNTGTGNFAFTPLVNIEAGTLIHFTDQGRANTNAGFSGWRLNGVGRFHESPIYSWVAPTAVSAGTKVTVQDTVLQGMSFASAGDSLMAFQGDVYNPSFIAAIGFGNNPAFITTGTSTLTTTYLPAPLALGTSAVSNTSTNTNFGYGGGASTVGTAVDLRASANTTSSWIRNEMADQFGPAGLTVTDATNAPIALKGVGGFNFGTGSGLNPTAQIPNTTFSSFGYSGTGADTSGTAALSLSGKSFEITGGWDVNSLDPNSQYLGFTVDIANGYSLTLEDIGASYQSDSALTVSKYYSTDNFLTSTKIGSDIQILNPNTIVADPVSNLGISGLTGQVSFRFYGLDAPINTTPKLSIDEVWLQGTVSIPEPSAAMITALGTLTLTLLRRRRKP